MAIVIGTYIASNFGNDINNSVSLNSLTLAAGGLAILAMTVRVQSGIILPPTAPVWNGQSFTLRANIEDSVGDAQSRLLVYSLVASSGATANVTWSFDQYTTLSAGVIPITGANTTTPIGDVVTQSRWLSSGWAAPSLSVTDSVAGDVILSVLGSPGWDQDYTNLSAITWTPGAGQSSIFDQNNTAGATNGYMRALASSKAGASGSVNIAWSKSSGSPGYQHMAFAVKVASSITVDAITTGGVSGLKVGQAFAFATTGLSTITSINAKTAATPAAQTNATAVVHTSGDGTAAIPFFADGSYMPFPGTVTVTITGSEGAPTKNVTFSIPDDHIDVQFSSVSLQDNTYLGYALNAIGHPIVNGEFCYYQSVNSLIIGSDGKISVASATTTTIFIHKLSGLIEGYDVNITESGGISSVKRMVSKAMVSRSLVSRVMARRL